MNDFLEQMAISSMARASEAQATISLERLTEECDHLSQTIALAHQEYQFGVIAEIKVRSPAEGVLDSGVSDQSILQRADDYIQGGASVLSVLTEPSRFAGSLEYLTMVANAAHLKNTPVMRKDFLVDVYQVYEARAAGADGVLLIARILSDANLSMMLEAAESLDLFVLLEAFDLDDLNRCKAYAAPNVLIGLNCRDLSTLKIDPERFYELADQFPDDAIRVAESGVTEPADARKLGRAGYQMALIGTSLMRAESSVDTLKAFIKYGNEGLRK